MAMQGRTESAQTVWASRRELRLDLQTRARCGHITELKACLTGLGPERCSLSDLFQFSQPYFMSWVLLPLSL